MVVGQGTDVHALLDRWPFWHANAFRWPVRRVWGDAAGTAALVEVGDAAMLVGLGAPAALAGVISAADDLPPQPGHTMLTRGTWAHVAPAAREHLGLAPARGWDWLVCAAVPPAQPGEERVELLTGTDRLARVSRVLGVAYPERGPRRDDAEKAWWGWAGDDGSLGGVGAATAPEPSGAGEVHLSSIAVLPQLRRRGAGAALTARLTRWGLERGSYVHLGMWADNDGARRVYERLGYAVGHEVENLAGV
ncbi:GNAT family N-acetyltransferase [Georgenia wangjunii]|uniref:GNAT family N-acetyltransferase n=1 Tax=Georgenia wangjunii TaxID=3117730 RepID=UPI002F260AA1